MKTLLFFFRRRTFGQVFFYRTLLHRQRLTSLRFLGTFSGFTALGSESAAQSQLNAFQASKQEIYMPEYL